MNRFSSIKLICDGHKTKTVPNNWLTREKKNVTSKQKLCVLMLFLLLWLFLLPIISSLSTSSTGVIFVSASAGFGIVSTFSASICVSSIGDNPNFPKTYFFHIQFFFQIQFFLKIGFCISVLNWHWTRKKLRILL